MRKTHGVASQCIEITPSECHAQLATLQETSEQKKLPQLWRNAELAALREQNQAYREALIKDDWATRNA
jgi:hypothetical protein